jgi:hypothetical protein
MKVAAFLHEVEGLAGRGEHRASAARIHAFVTQNFERRDLALVDLALRELDASKLTSYELTSFLIVTRPQASELAGRKAVRRDAERALIAEVGAEEAALTLRFL